ncbi:MAG TPA: hypothetical protein VJI71_02195 [Candidatus Norongarragalinales archaeon]|nr:hypothetical protein [Candidatus Norongarragalinales archaeon]
MNMNVKLSGIAEQIVESAVRSGIAKTKTDVLMIGLLELNNKYDLLERIENKEDLREAKRVLSEIRSGKQKLYSKKEFEKQTGLKL